MDMVWEGVLLAKVSKTRKEDMYTMLVEDVGGSY